MCVFFRKECVSACAFKAGVCVCVCVHKCVCSMACVCFQREVCVCSKGVSVRVQRCVAHAVIELVVVAFCRCVSAGTEQLILPLSLRNQVSVAVACYCLESPWPLPSHFGLEAICDSQAAAQRAILRIKIKLYHHVFRATKARIH